MKQRLHKTELHLRRNRYFRSSGSWIRWSGFLFGLSLALLTAAQVACRQNASDDKRKSTATMAPEPGRAHLASPVQVRVIGKEFHWEFQYPGPDGKLDTPDDVTAERILRLPPDQKVEFEVTSSDYVYILGIPVNENGSRSVDTEKAKTGTGQADKIREIAVPGMVHRIEHQFHRTGRLDLMVDPLCGFQALHDPRMGQILISPDYDFRSLFPCQQQPDR